MLQLTKLGVKERISDNLLRKAPLRVIAFLLSKPKKEHTIMEVTKGSKVNFRTAYKIVELLVRLGAAEQRKAGNSLLFRINERSPHLKAIETILKIDTEPLRQAGNQFALELTEKCKEVAAVLLFGSVAKGTATIDSDIDIFIVYEKDKKHVEQKTNILVEKFARNYGVRIVPLLESSDEFVDNLEAKSPFETGVWKEAIIFTGGKVLTAKTKHLRIARTT